MKNIHFDISSEFLITKFREKVKIESFDFKSYLKSSWNHFVLYSGSYRFFKSDILAILVKDNFALYLKEALSFLVQAYQKSQYLFFVFFCRFVIKAMDNLEDSLDNRNMIFKLLEVIMPSKFPGFTAQFIEILNHNFIAKFLDKPEFFMIYQDLLNILEYDDRYEYAITQFFTTHSNFVKKFNLYLSYTCPQHSVNLKNLFNQSKSKGMVEKTTNPYFSVFYNLGKHIRVNTTYGLLIENLNEQNSITLYIISCLRSMLDRNINSREIILMLLIRNYCENCPLGVKLACEELFMRGDSQYLIREYKRQYFNKY